MPTYPYISGSGAVVATFIQLRKNPPPKVDASYLQRFQLAPANESYVISVLRFLGLIDENGDRVEGNAGFLYGNDEAFKEGLEAATRRAYADLFNEMGDEALTSDRSSLAHWFRSSDKTSELVGTRQASTFLALAALAGHGELPARATGTKRVATNGATPAKKTAVKKSVAKKAAQTPSADDAASGDGGQGEQSKVKIKTGSDVGLTVRIEVNLPPGGDADTYDAIFASIKKHLMS